SQMTWPSKTALRACFKTAAWSRAPGFGVPRSGGSAPGRLKAGLPNRILKHFLSGSMPSRQGHLLWALGLFFLVSFLVVPGDAQTRLPVAIAETSVGSNVGDDLRDAWLGIAAATNSWALAIRGQPQWEQVRKATIPETIKLAQTGVAVAQLRLAYGYFAGDGLERDYSQAVSWSNKAAEAGLAPAQFLLGIAYLNGLGVPQNFETAVEHLNQAAEQGFAGAEFQLGLCYLRGGPGINQAPARGIKWLTRAAEQGKPNAQQFLAWCYASGTGVNEDPAQALAWCRRAAEQELPTAEDFLGMFCASGYGSTQAWAQAVTWFRRAAERGL